MRTLVGMKSGTLPGTIRESELALPSQAVATPKPFNGVLVTGTHRSGTTWVGRIIAGAPGTCYLHEPFKPGWHPPYTFMKFPHYFCHVDAHNADRYEPALAKTLGLHFSWRHQFMFAPSVGQAFGATRRWAHWAARRWLGRKPVMKDPIAFFAAPWLAERFGLDVLVMIRHPAAFASSIKLKRWHFNFDHLLRQKELMEHWLHPFEREIDVMSRNTKADLVDQAILLWRAFHHVIGRYQAEHPDWQFVRHEDLATDPVNGFRKMFERLRLPFTPDCELAVRRTTDARNVKDANAAGLSTMHVCIDSASNIHNWRRRLTSEEINRVRAGTEDIAGKFYADTDW